MRIGSKDSFDRSLFAMERQSATIDKLRQEYLSNNKILSPEDDPVGAGRVIQLDQALTDTEIFQKNQTGADSALTDIDSKIQSINSIITHINETFIQLGSDALSDDNIKVLTEDIKSHLKDLLSIANSRDAHDHAYFSGFQISTSPFSQENGRYVYHGDQGKRYLSITSTIRTQVNVSGDELFEHILTGNGSFSVKAQANNTGTAVALPSEQIDASKWNAHADAQGYQIIFHQEGSGSHATYTYDVIGQSTGQSIFTGQPSATQGALPKVWHPGDNIVIQDPQQTQTDLGLSIKVSGLPNNNDQFTIQHAESDNAFNLIQQAIDDISKAPQTTQGRQQIKEIVAHALDNVRNIQHHFAQVNARIGLSQKTIAQAKDDSEKQSLQLKADRAKLKEFDYVSGTAEIMHQSMIFDAIQRSFAKFAQNSLFQYL